jgi:DNA-binding transcriptional LysR family regulator
MNFKQVETFRAVVLTGSMTVAAQQLHTSQSNVSRVISRFESEVGFKLFDRHAGRLLTTRAGEALFKDVKRAFTSLENLSDSARAIKEGGVGTLRVGASASLSIGVLPLAIRKFREQYPLVNVIVETSESSNISSWVAHQHCDIGFVSYVSEKPGVTAELFNSSNAICVVPCGHRLSHHKVIAPIDLEGESFISLPSGNVSRKMIDEAFAGVARVLLLETPFAATICCMVREGIGVSIVNPIFCHALRLPGIAFVAFEPAVPFNSYVLTSDMTPRDTHTDHFVDCVRFSFNSVAHHHV